MFVYLIDDITRNLQSTSATQGGTMLYTDGLISAKLLPHYGAQRLITAPASSREHSPDGATSTHPIKLLTTQFIDPERVKGRVGLVG